MKMIIVNQVTGRNDIDTGAESVTPTVINAESVRNFYPRKNEAPGTRITFDDGGGFPVTDTFDEIAAKLAGVGLSYLNLTMVVDVPAVIDEDTGEHLNADDEGRTPVSVKPDLIRCFYPRKDNKPGTRITFAKGSGIAVQNLFEEVTTLCAALPVAALPAPGRR
ncbi:hypothetical protein [Bradyrhizobium sp. RT10b]|uniref:hypothetical protein n=1 Tax=Bradyrhizobium sp. RT10b TaxID=3156331 RepID=UPI0033977AB5